jgi:DNA helicase IV
MSVAPDAGAEQVEAAREQQELDTRYAALDDQRDHAARSLEQTLRRPTVGTPQGLTERDAMASFYERRVRELRAVDERLCFGRLDLRSGTTRYIGRIGLQSEGGADTEPLLVDWRAPVAAPFYQATPAAPGDVVRRRHITTQGRTVTAVEDEALDLDALDPQARSTLVGEGALMAAVGRARTGRMADIVATLQAEQDRIVRGEVSGVLVVQGGPGTGKTAVALHRIAYLLFTHRERLERSGVLLVGPSPLFLRYIERVLPALGETGTVMRTPGTLYPGVHATVHDRPATAAIKGDLRMVEVMARAVARRQRVPADPVVLDVDGVALTVRPEAFARARQRARSSGRPHNAARETFARSMLDHLVDRYARAQSLDLRDDPETRSDLLADLRDSIDVRRAVNLAWMPQTPERLLAELWRDPQVLAEVAPHLSPTDRGLLARPDADQAWTIDDVPLLDELAELLGDDDTAGRSAAALAKAQRAQDLEAARASLRTTGGDAARMVTAEMLIDRFAESGPRLTVAEHAERDRTWAFGHVVVDEAQELSPMQWRVLARRCPSRSMTLVGDVAQTGAAAGTVRWEDTLDRLAPGRWRTEELTINYRTPARIVRYARDAAATAGLLVAEQRTMREGDRDVDVVPIVDVGDVLALVEREVAGLVEGRIAVIAPSGTGALGAAALRAAASAVRHDVGGEEQTLDARISVLDPTASKGLEVDAVIVVDPDGITDVEGGRGASDLFVAMTRATRSLVVAVPERRR